jgi:hypothetical protein
MSLMLLLVLAQAPQPIKLSPIYRRTINDTLSLVVSAGENDLGEHAHLSQFTVGLLNRGVPHNLMGVVTDRGWFDYHVLRADDSSLVVGRFTTYSSGPRAKLFFHPGENYILRQIDYPPDIGLLAVDSREVAEVLELPPAIVKQLEEPQAEITAQPDSLGLPLALRDHPMPKSTYSQFARARPNRVKDGYEGEGTTIDESPGPYQVVGTRIWFGKVFYDGEGTTGVGGLGYFDTSVSSYAFMPVPLLADWSASAILVEPAVVWIALVGYPEGEAYAGGLLRYDRTTGRSRKYPTAEVVQRMLRWKDGLYLGTSNGAYRIRRDTLTRYRVEPDINNRFMIIPEIVQPAKPHR